MSESIYCPSNSSSFSSCHLHKLQENLQLLTDKLTSFCKGINQFDTCRNPLLQAKIVTDLSEYIYKTESKIYLDF